MKDLKDDVVFQVVVLVWGVLTILLAAAILIF